MNQTGIRMTDMQAHLYICRAIFSGECGLRDQSALFTHSFRKKYQ
ncbi:hypothetical protein VSK91_13375 [Bacillus swezeyi]